MIRISILVLALSLLSACAPKKEPLELTKEYVQAEVNELLAQVDFMLIEAEADRFDQLPKKFKEARNRYKRAESLIEYYFPPTADLLNGTAIDESEEYDDKVIYATGFQVLEEFLFPEVDRSMKADIVRELKLMKSGITGLFRSIERVELNEPNVIEAVRLELFRVMSLSLSGFDSPVAGNSLSEISSALDGIQAILGFYSKKLSSEKEHSFEELSSKFADAQKFLKEHNDFNTFNHATFIKDHLNPLCQLVHEYQKSIGIENNKYITALDLEKSSFFDKNLFRDEYFTPVYGEQINDDLIDLGRILFFDPILSSNNSRSCNSCHKPEKAFSDGQRKSLAFNMKGEVSRNSPSVINTGFQKAQFYDSRVAFLEDQISDVIGNKKELHGSIAESAKKLRESEEYLALFNNAFRSKNKGAIDEKNIQIALASYIRSLKSLDSPFDQYMRGNNSAMDKDQIEGFNLFMGKGKCGTCHFMPLFNGTVPPSYSKSESEVLGVPDKPDTIHAKIDADPGKYNTYQRQLFKNAFKTPTVRNATLTSPYMHNGVYHSLEEVVDFYNRGGGAGIGIDVSNQTLPPDKLNLTPTEQKQIIAFIGSLTDTTGLARKPSLLPKFPDEQINRRKVGGIY